MANPFGMMNEVKDSISPIDQCLQDLAHSKFFLGCCLLTKLQSKVCCDESTQYLSSEDLYINAYYELVNQYDYHINVINQKITQPDDYNYSDDELAFLPYFTYMFSGRSEMQQEFLLSITRAWNLARKGSSFAMSLALRSM
jgi:hypothetical protein